MMQKATYLKLFFTVVLSVLILPRVVFASEVQKITSLKQAIVSNIKPELWDVPKTSNEHNADFVIKELQKIFNQCMMPFTKEITEKDGNTKLRVADLKKIEAITPAQAQEKFNILEEAFGRPGLAEDIFAHLSNPEVKNLIYMLFTQPVLFDATDREKISQLLISWFTAISTYIPQLSTLFNDPQEIEKLMRDPAPLITTLKKMRSKNQHILAPLLSIWTLIMWGGQQPGFAGDKAFTLLFDYLPQSKQILQVYTKAKQVINSKIVEEIQEKFASTRTITLNADFFVWALVGVLFLPEPFEQAFVEPQLKAIEESRKQIEENRKRYEEQEREYKRLETEWISKHPGAIVEANDYALWGQHDYSDEDFEKYKNERMVWLKAHPDKTYGDFRRDFFNRKRRSYSSSE